MSLSTVFAEIASRLLQAEAITKDLSNSLNESSSNSRMLAQKLAFLESDYEKLQAKLNAAQMSESEALEQARVLLQRLAELSTSLNESIEQSEKQGLAISALSSEMESLKVKLRRRTIAAAASTTAIVALAVKVIADSVTR